MKILCDVAQSIRNFLVKARCHTTTDGESGNILFLIKRNYNLKNIYKIINSECTK